MYNFYLHEANEKAIKSYNLFERTWDTIKDETRQTEPGLVKARLIMTVAKNNRKITNSNSRSKKVKISATAVLPVEKQNLIIRKVLDRLDGRSVILHGIEKTKS